MIRVVLLSGGMDSCALLSYVLSAYETETPKVHAVTVNYGQKHVRELEAAQAIWEHYRQVLPTPLLPENLHIVTLKVEGWKSALTDRCWAIPEGHYEEETMKQTVVPNRNMVLLALAAGIGQSYVSPDYADPRGVQVFYGAHAGDHAIYPDCRRPFVRAMQEALHLSHWGLTTLEAPFLGITKDQIVSQSLRPGKIPPPYHLTWSCYQGGERHCGKCGTCVERREAFELAGVEDPTLYEEENQNV